ncbi:MAG TPA: hypothetical protein VKA53_10635, partial [Thermoanaerobaculia bacterium]|nr:hypothetical protein [Thermoanaerobaculia bacterium]
MMARTLCFNLTVTVALFFVASLAFAQNRVTNPGFDTGVSGWDLHNSSWNPAWAAEDADGSTHSGS